jgi:hypothetical protein
MKALIETYEDNGTIYLIFTKETPESKIYLYAYKQAIKTNTKVGQLIYRDGIYQITLNQFET